MKCETWYIHWLLISKPKPQVKMLLNDSLYYECHATNIERRKRLLTAATGEKDATKHRTERISHSRNFHFCKNKISQLFQWLCRCFALVVMQIENQNSRALWLTHERTVKCCSNSNIVVLIGWTVVIVGELKLIRDTSSHHQLVWYVMLWLFWVFVTFICLFQASIGFWRTPRFRRVTLVQASQRHYCDCGQIIMNSDSCSHKLRITRQVKWGFLELFSFFLSRRALHNNNIIIYTF